MSSPECGESWPFRSVNPFMTSDEISPELLSQLKHLRNSCHARSPADLRRLEWPRAIEVSSDVVQEWLTKHLLRDEAAFAASMRQRLTLESSADDDPLQVSGDDLGAISWRRAFMKRLIQVVEAGFVDRPDADQCEVKEELLMEVTRLMIAVSRQPGLSARRFYYNLRDVEYSAISIEADATISGGTTGLRTWQASIQLANHLLVHTDLIAGKSVLELGSGMGVLCNVICQIQKGTYGSAGNVIASDLDSSVLEALRKNLSLNGNDHIPTLCLDWADADAPSAIPHIDVIVAADVAYDPVIIEPLVRCLAHLLHRDRGSVGYLAMTHRSPETMQLFLSECATRQINLLPCDLDCPQYGEGLVGGDEEGGDVRLFRLSAAA